MALMVVAVDPPEIIADLPGLFFFYEGQGPGSPFFGPWAAAIAGAG